MKNRVIVFLILWGFLLPGAELHLLKEGKTDYTLTLPSALPPLVQLAGRELKNYWKKSTGSTLSSGNGGEARQIILKLDRSLSSQESMIYISGNHLVLSGGDDWGILYAVYTFLENHLGIRWYSAFGDELVPRHQNIIYDRKSYKVKPVIPARHIMTFPYYGNPGTEMFFLRNRMNVCQPKWDKIIPGVKYKYEIHAPHVHTLFHYIPPREDFPSQIAWKQKKAYFKTHPDFFSMNEEGKRVDKMQLCFSNPALRREFTRRFLAHLKKNNERGVYSISCIDNGKDLCYCKKCQEMIKKYDSSGAPLFDYLIKLANHISKQYPNIQISTLAYQKTIKPPKIKRKLPDNLIIIYAPSRADFSKPLNHSNNTVFYNYMKEWAKLTKNLWIWYYPYTYYNHGPRFGIERGAADIPLLNDVGFTGTYYEHDVSVSEGQDFADLKTWMFLKLFQNPEQDHHALVREFCDFYYGKASGLMLSYIQDLEKYACRTTDFITWDSVPLKEFRYEENLTKWYSLFEKMEQLTAETPDTLHRIRAARIQLDILTLFSNYQLLHKKHPAVFPSPKIIEQRVKNTVSRCMKRRHSQKCAVKYYQPTLERLSDAMSQADCAFPRPLPKAFDGIPEEKIHLLYPDRGQPSWKIVKIKDSDAALGYAVYDPNVEKDYPEFTVGLYDQAQDKAIGKTKIKKADIRADQYHLYKIGEFPITSCYSYLWTTRWCLRLQMGHLFSKKQPDKKFEIWLSVKFEGPAYASESRSRINRALVDRLIAIEK